MNKVILIGESHYHGLNLARSFGIKGIKPYGIIVNSKPGFLDACKYWEKTYHVADDEAAIKLAKELFENEKEKPLILPWSDGALFAIDQHLDELKEHFYVSSIGGKQGEICCWLNKKRQAELAKEFGLSVSPTEEIRLPLQDSDVQAIVDTFSFPLFLKPVDSREGSKNDMRKIESTEQLRAYSETLSQNGFHRILVQEYLEIDVEYDLMGYCSKEGHNYTVIKKKRTWPVGGGATCSGTIIRNADTALFERIVNVLINMGYEGPFDIELLQSCGKTYFNEINWRGSANVYAAYKSGNNYPYLWYLTKTKRAVVDGFNNSIDSSTDFFFMNEFWDVQYVRQKRISLVSWIRDVRSAKAFGYYDKDDLKPFFAKFKQMISNRFIR